MPGCLPDRGLKLCGYAYETGINELVINSIDEYVTQIEILTENNFKLSVTKQGKSGLIW